MSSFHTICCFHKENSFPASICKNEDRYFSECFEVSWIACAEHSFISPIIGSIQES